MSRGFGKWQRLILGELAGRECFYLLELLPTGHRKAEFNALSRAAWRLSAAGLIRLQSYMCGAGSERAKLLVQRHGADTPARRPAFNHDRRPISVGRVPFGNSSHT